MPTAPAATTTLVSANATSVTSGTLATTAGDILVVKYSQEDNSGTMSITGGGLTWTSRAVSQAASNCRVQIWTATATGGNVSVTVTKSASARRITVVLEKYTSAKLAATPAIVQTNGTGAPSATLTTAAAGSCATWVIGDWAAVNGSSRAYRSSAVEDGYDFNSGVCTTYDAYQSAPTAGAQTLGLTAPTGQTWAIAGIEIQDAGGTPATATPAVVAAVATVPAPTLSAQANNTITPAVVAAVASVPTPTVNTSGALDFVAASTSGSDTSATSHSTAKPTGTSTGDLVLLHLTRWLVDNSAFATLTPPTGAVLIRSTTLYPTGSGSKIQSDVYGIVAGAETSYTFSYAAATWGHVDAQAWKGADTSSIGTIVSNSVTGGATTVTAVSATAASGNAAAHFVNNMNDSASTTHTPPTGYTEAIDSLPAASNYKKNLTAGTETASGATLSVSTDFVATLVIIPQTTVSTPATATPAVVAGVATVPAVIVTAGGNANVQPANVSGVTAVAAPVVVVSSATTPSTVLAVTSMDTMLGAISDTATPSVVAGVTTVGAPTVQTAGNVSVTATTVPGVTTVPAPVVRGSASATPAAVAGVTTVGTSAVSAAASVAPSVLAGVTSVGAPTETATALATPAVTPGVTTLGAPAIQNGSGSTVAPAVVAANASLATPTVTATSTATPAPATIQGATAMAASSITASGRATPATVSGTATLGAPILALGSSATVAATTVAAVTTVFAPTLKGSASVNLSVPVAGSATVPAPFVSTGTAPSGGFKLWNGSNELPLTVSVWNGTTETPITGFTVAP